MAFQMNSGSGGNRFAPMSDINVTPMVDVMLVLLIIFMVAAPMMMQGPEVDLPKADAKAMNTKDQELVLTMTKDGRFLLGDDLIPKEQLSEKISTNPKLKSEKKILLRADAGIDYGEVMKVMSMLEKAGVESIGLPTDPQQSAIN